MERQSEMVQLSKDGSEKQIYKDEFKDKLMMSPVKKWVKYDKFPYKLVIQFALIILTSIQIEYTHSNFSPFQRANDQEWISIFYNDPQVSQGNGIYQYNILPDFQAHLQSLFQNLATYNANYFQQINLDAASVYLKYMPSTLSQKNLYENFQKEPINPYIGITSPFNMNDIHSIKHFLVGTPTFVIVIQDLAVSHMSRPHPYACYDFSLQYQFVESTFIVSQLESKGKLCQDYLVEIDNKSSTLLFEGSQIIVSISIIILAVISAVLSLKYLFELIKDYMAYKSKGQIMIPVVQSHHLPKQKKHNQSPYDEDEGDDLIKILTEQRPWHALTITEKMQYIDFWFVAVLFGNYCQIHCCLYIILQDKNQNTLSRQSEYFLWIQGLGCAMAWLSSLKYFDYVSKFNITSDVVKKSFPKIGRHFIGFIPILMAFIVVGMSSFGASQRFATFRDTFATLWSLLLGDSIHDITTDIKNNGISPFLAILYSTGFIVIFILSVNNIMVAIIQDVEDQRGERLKKDKEFKKLIRYRKEIARRNQKREMLQSGLQHGHSNPYGFSDQPVVAASPEQQLAPQPQTTSKSQIFNAPRVLSSQDLTFETQNITRTKTVLAPNEPQLGSIQADETSSSTAQRIKGGKQEEEEDQQNKNVSGEVRIDMKKQSSQSPIKKGFTFPKRVNKRIDEDMSEDSDSASSGSEDGEGGEEEGEGVEQIESEIPLQKSTSQQKRIFTEGEKAEITQQVVSRLAKQASKNQKQQGQSGGLIDTEGLDPIEMTKQFSEEVDQLVQQKLEFRNLFDEISRGFNSIQAILDKQAYEIKDSLYLYRLSHHARLKILQTYTKTLAYFEIKTKQA